MGHTAGRANPELHSAAWDHTAPSQSMTSDYGALPTAEEVIEIHDEIEEQYELKHTGAYSSVPELHLRELLAEAEEVDGVYHRAAFLLRKLITTHVFRDGNKRTAWVTTREYLVESGRRPAERGERVPRILRKIRRYELEEIARWLESGQIDEDRLYP